MTPLQSLEFVRRARLGSELLSLALALAIGYVALRGYYQNQSRPMLFVGVGFVLVIPVAGVLSAVGAFGPLPVAIGNALAQAVELLGLGSILYGLQYDPS
jgi:uncharacterized membrane protein (UPF0136 family)